MNSKRKERGARKMEANKMNIINMTNINCETKYPIVLVHGTGCRDRDDRSCWGRIPQTLESQGARVYFGNQDAWGTIEENALTVKESIERIITKTNCGKVNVIAISKGGLEARYMIHKFSMADKVASLTTIATPHYGSKTMDFLCSGSGHLLKASSVIINRIYKKQGDKNPDFLSTIRQFTTSFSEEFNREVLDCGQVHYQSYASTMKKSYSDMLLFVQHLVVKRFDGECDGLVSVNSAKWGEFRGVITGKGVRGVSHADLRDRRKKDSYGTDIRRVYVGIVGNLREQGF